MATKIIHVEYQLELPNDFLVDHSLSEGKTRTCLYDGPDKIYLQIGEDGTEKYGPLTADDIADGRPMPADVVEWFEVDCTTDPLICQLRGQPIDELEEEYTGSTPHPQSPSIDGYPQFSYQTPLMPDDLYDKHSVKIVDGELTIRRYDVREKLIGDKDEDFTWDDIRRHRDGLLQNTDGKVTEDMPDSLKNAWKEYRQKLRDFPETMQAAGVQPNIAYYMIPENPDALRPALNGGLSISI
jgi:hypothetical protein